MEKLLTLIEKCKCGVYLNVNIHRDYHESVESHIENCRLLGEIDLDPEIYEKMKELNTVVDLQFYPDTPTGFFQIYHFSVEEALKIALKTFE